MISVIYLFFPILWSRLTFASHLVSYPASEANGNGHQAAGSQDITLDFFLISNRTDHKFAISSLKNISSPTSSKYGHHWTSRQVRDFFAPSPEQIREVVVWVIESGVPLQNISVSADRNHISLKTSTSVVAKMLHTNFYRHTDDGHAVIDMYHIPLPISKHVDFVLPLFTNAIMLLKRPNDDRYQKLRRDEASKVTHIDCFRYTATECLRLLYNVPDYENMAPHPNSSFGMYQPAWATWLADDMDKFFDMFHPDVVSRRPKILPINGGYRQTDIKLLPFNLEPNLDFKYGLSLANPLPVTNIQARSVSIWCYMYRD